MNALSDPQAGDYVNEHFVASFQKVGTFRIVDGKKQGGNVASYFCTPDGLVLHAIAGPVDGATLRREAEWVVQTRMRALAHCQGNHARYQALCRQAHDERLRQDHGLALDYRTIADNAVTAVRMSFAHDKDGRRVRLNNQGRVHVILAAYPLPRLDQVYGLVFEKILGEKISVQQVQEIETSAAGKRGGR